MCPSSASMGATLSLSGRHRYNLTREVGTDVGGQVCWVMLNPSTADAETDDPTIRRCINFTREWEYGKLVVVNLWPYRATKPADLKRWLGKPDTADFETAMRTNYLYQHRALDTSSLIICAWGNEGDKVGRPLAAEWIEHYGYKLHILGHNKDGQPKHPLYVPADAVPLEWGL